MGQQQLLLVILVTIIVGIATVVAINTFSSAAEGANLDAVRQDVGNIAASAHIYFMKPEILGGGEQDFSKMTFRNITFASDTISGDAYIAGNQNGTYRLLNLTETSVDIEAYPSSLEGYEHGSGAGSQKLTATVTRDNLEWTSNIPID
jgi:type II secretory pathway pseudopilin PulG